MDDKKGLKAKISGALRKIHNSSGSRQSRQSTLEINQFEEAVRVAPERKEAWMNLGRAYDRSFQFEKALKCKLKAAELSPDDAEVRYGLGCTFCAKGDFPAAIKSFEEALVLKPDFLEACEAIAEQFQIIGKYGKADEWLSKADRIRYKE